jgi:hypothetical protein
MTRDSRDAGSRAQRRARVAAGCAQQMKVKFARFAEAANGPLQVL